MEFSYINIKRIFDLLVVLLFSPLFLLIILIISILIYINLGWPIFFNQKRLGHNNKVFTIYKFRTMTNSRDELASLLPDHQRLTHFGLLLRKTSMDELPSLINVFKGQMSLVGPRPFLAEYYSLYSPEQLRRHDVLPGVTGWAQVNGRNDISWQQKFEYDVWYVDNCSFLLDLKIFYLTVIKVLKREGISQFDQATVENFKGNL
jgi:lipopolysaccharide/colanic/teichoic acid biosynthesis glycosyltransferase